MKLVGHCSKSVIGVFKWEELVYRTSHTRYTVCVMCTYVTSCACDFLGLGRVHSRDDKAFADGTLGWGSPGIAQLE